MTVEINTNVDGKGTAVIKYIGNETDGLVTVRSYTIFYDEYTGDWGVSCRNDDTIQSPWLMSRDNAIKYVLYHLDILEEADYQRAPDRC